MVEIDIVIPYHGDWHWELEQAVRLLNKHFKYRDLYLVGENLPQIGKHIDFIQSEKKEVNIWQKTATACMVPGVSDNFLFMNDDHFLLRP